MKRPAKGKSLQLNLPLVDAPAAAMPGNKQRELAAALVELLINAARESAEPRENGGEHEPEADR
jgi:hypothetical protein